MKLRSRFIVPPRRKIILSKYDPSDTAGFDEKDEAKKLLEKNIERLAELQHRLYAEKRHALLVIFQAVDAGGKDGTIRHVMSGVNPQGCHVTTFKQPSEEELGHDFLWRVHRAVPSRGEIGVFNRSHYEDVLVVRVKQLAPKNEWAARYKQINEFEQHLAENGTIIVKFCLHISRQEQLERFSERLNDPTKCWKFSAADLEVSALWDDYERAYEDVLTKCNTAHAPWYIIPANKKWFRNLAVSQILVETLERMKLKYPEPSTDLKTIRKALKHLDRA